MQELEEDPELRAGLNLYRGMFLPAGTCLPS
jgi:hypothetical protein